MQTVKVGREEIPFEPSPQRLAELGEWFGAERGRLLRFATIVCGDPHVAEDLVQEAFVRAYLAGARAQPEMGAYARRAILNLVRSGFRRRAAEKRAYQGVDHPETAVDHPRPDDDMWDAIQSLAPRQRAVLAMRFYEDMSERDIASALGISPGNVKKHASRGVQRLRETLDRGRLR